MVEREARFVKMDAKGIYGVRTIPADIDVNK